jgi:DNA-binding transcriptional LysR family regulator
VDSTEVILESVREGVYLFGLAEGKARAAGLRLEQFVEDEVVMVAGTTPAFCKYQQLAASVTTAQDLCQLPLIWRESGSGTRTVVEAALRKLGMKLSLSPAFETSRRPSSATLMIASAVSFTSS